MGGDAFDDLTLKIFDNIDEGIYLTDRDRNIVYWNRGAERITGFPASELVGKRCSDNLLNHVDGEGRHLCEKDCPLLAVMETDREQNADVFLHHREGHRLPIKVKAFPFRNGEGEVQGILEVFTDASEVRLTRRKIDLLRRELMTDALTGIGNRRYCDSELDAFFLNREREDFSFAAALCDIDDFKRINDRYGHDRGDRILKMVAATLEHTLREGDVLGRWGGEEFLILLSGVSDDREVLAIMERIRRLVSESFLIIDGETVGVTLSIGASPIRVSDNQESLFRRMDQLMYRSKSEGKDRVTLG